MAEPRPAASPPPPSRRPATDRLARNDADTPTRGSSLNSKTSAWLDSLPDGHDPEATLRPAGDNGGFPISQTGYAIQRELGRGGIGAVHAAEQRAFGRTVALKALLVDNEATRRAFLAEAVATARLEHPNIVPVHDLVIGADGVPQLAMKLVVGSTWKSLLHPKSEAEKAKVADWELDDHLEILLKVCDAVRFAHTREILHRDLKPENVMVGGFGEVLVMDWGCAVSIAAKRPHPLLPLASELSVIAGTPAYMAPELAYGDGTAIGPWSDVYLLGAILYEVLCGTPPHRAKGVKAALELARIGDIESPEQREPGRAMPDELVSLALDALVRDPSKRLRDVAGFAARIREYLRHSQAAILLDHARDHLKEAENGSRGAADEALRRAIGCCEQAQELSPDFRAARRLHVRVALAAAASAMATGSFHLARTQAETARRLAKELKQSHDLEQAEQLLARATKAERDRANRARHVYLLRMGMIGSGVVVVIGLVVGIALIALEQRATNQALKEAQDAKASTQLALTNLKEEQSERQRQAKEAAPRFLAEAGSYMQKLQWDDAQRSAEIATGLDPDSPAGWLLLAEIHCGNADLPRARHAVDKAGAKGGKILAVINRAEPRLRNAQAQDRQKELNTLADDLRAAEAGLAAAFLRRDTKDGLLTVLEGARSRVAAANPQVSALNWKCEVIGELVRVDCSGNPALTDLSPLAGLPIAELNCSGTGITQMGFATAMRLTELDCSDTKIDDLSALASLKITKLIIGKNPRLTSIGALTAMPLRYLDCTGLNVKDWSPLRGKPLQTLYLGQSDFTDFTMLAGMSLQDLAVDSLPISDLGVFRGLTLRRLSISGTQATDLAPLKAMPLETLIIGSAPVSDLSPLSGKTLQQLGLKGNKSIKDLTVMRRAPLIAIDLRDSAITDVEMLAGFTKLRTLSGNWVPSLRLLTTTEQPNAAKLELRSDTLVGRLGSVPALADTVAGLRALMEVARWRQRPGSTPPPNVTLLGGNAFRLIEVPVTWSEAKRIASALGGRLACLEDDAAIDFAKKNWPAKSYFLGASRSGQSWKWLSGSAVKVERSRWEPGVPPLDGNEANLRVSDKGWAEASPESQAGILVEWTK